MNYYGQTTGVETLHPRYGGWFSKAACCRDVLEGSPAVHKYVPQLSLQTLQDYQAYLARPAFFNATARTLTGLSGAIFRRPPEVTAPTAMDPQLLDVDLAGTSLVEMATYVTDEVLAVGRHGILIDYNDAAGRPVWVNYAGEDVLNWEQSLFDGRPQLTFVVLRETVWGPDGSVAPGARFQRQPIVQYRAMELTDSGLMVTLWQKESSGIRITTTALPVRRGQALRFIPFVFLGPEGVDSTPSRPPLIDLADINLSHFRSSCDLEHGRFWTSLPTPWVSGWKGVDGPTIGPSRVWAMEDPGARAGFLEFSGAGLASLERALVEKERQMQVVGARLLESQATHQEAAATVRLRQAGDLSAISRLAHAVSRGLTQALRYHAWWWAFDNTDDVQVRLNQDFFESYLAPAEITALMQLWQHGAISYHTLFANLEAGELTRAGVTAEDERAAIAAVRQEAV
ncbi:MAG TPA: DUF4055 domain-containing protein [Gemmatimonadaceae bacterium]|nr:DUF4055 domain-containing protein [Gemmatimonadaceae bacterium]